MEMQEFKSILDAANERTLAASNLTNSSWRRIPAEDFIAILEELQVREMLVKE